MTPIFKIDYNPSDIEEIKVEEYEFEIEEIDASEIEEIEVEEYYLTKTPPNQNEKY
jgi:hypothetical protein